MEKLEVMETMEWIEESIDKWEWMEKSMEVEMEMETKENCK